MWLLRASLLRLVFDCSTLDTRNTDSRTAAQPTVAHRPQLPSAQSSYHGNTHSPALTLTSLSSLSSTVHCIATLHHPFHAPPTLTPLYSHLHPLSSTTCCPLALSSCSSSSPSFSSLPPLSPPAPRRAPPPARLTRPARLARPAPLPAPPASAARWPPLLPPHPPLRCRPPPRRRSYRRRPVV